ncbi:MAG: adenylate/guanylate cyclase domain-containing protein [Solirubrobacterales bacterium]
MTELRNDEAERKQVTVLFADVSGSMDLAERQDPEEWRKIMQRFFSLLADAVHGFEGTVDKFTGDGIMAVFGAPIAHEDHAQRACYAALRMLDEVSEYAAELRREQGLNFSTRIGINSGEVVAGSIGVGGEAEYTAIGHTVGLAQRMEALAEPGKAYLTEHTADLAAGFLDLRDLDRFEIKGASQPVHVFELVGVGAARSRLDLSRQRGFSGFVGRDAENAVLDEALAEAEAGRGSMVAIVAEPGIGKSRLCHEFAQRCRDASLEVFAAQAQAHGTAVPYMPVLQMLRAFFGIGEREPEQGAREKIAGRALLLDAGFAEDLPLLFDFLGVPDPDRPLPQMSPEARQRALAAVVCRLVNAPSRRKTLILVIEDLHWLDEGSAAMLGELATAIEGTNTLAVVNFRPEFRPPWGTIPSYRELPLGPLTAADTRELLRDLAGEDPSLDGLDEPIHERTQGNPFFIEEIVRELAETGHLEGERGAYRIVRPIEDAGVPVTVQAVLAARIDRLSPDAKLLLQVASVVGREVSGRALRITAGLEPERMDPVVCELVDAGFVFEAELYPERVLAFRHPLTREVAYGTQLADRRAATHAAAARATIELEPERHDELAALIAHHLEEGREGREAARWYARAAHWAGHSRPQDALRLWRRVTELADDLGDDEEATALRLLSRMLQLEYAWRLGMDRSEQAHLEEEVSEIATAIGDVRSLAMLKLLTKVRPGAAEHTGEWVAAAEEAIALADETGEDGLRAAFRAAAAYAFMCAGDLDGMDAVVDEMLVILDHDPEAGAGIVVSSPVAWGLNAKSMVLRERGRHEEAEKLLDEALREAQERGDPETESWALGTKSGVLTDRGEVEAALAVALRNCELTERLGDVFSRTMALTELARARLEAGEYAEALEAIEAADGGYREAMGSGGEVEAWRGCLRALSLLGLGRREEALAQAETAVESAQRRALNWSLPFCLYALAQIRAAGGEADVAEALDEAIAITRRQGYLSLQERIEADREPLLRSAVG